MKIEAVAILVAILIVGLACAAGMGSLMAAMDPMTERDVAEARSMADQFHLVGRTINRLADERALWQQQLAACGTALDAATEARAAAEADAAAEAASAQRLQLDFFRVCASRAAVPSVTGCERFDLDHDCDVDMDDFGEFQANLLGKRVLRAEEEVAP